MSKINIYKKDLRRIYPIEVVWTEFKNNRKVPIIFNENSDVIESFTDYILHIAKDQIRNNTISFESEQSYNTAVESITYALVSLAKFLRHKRISWRTIDDDLLTEYRNWELLNVQSKKSARDELTNKRTVNQKLKLIYQFYAHMQFTGEINGRMGWDNYHITSICYDQKVNPTQNIRKKKLGKMMYPLLFKRTGDYGINLAQHYATDNEVEELKQYFLENQHGLECIAYRNFIMVELIEDTGWRSNSLVSLKTDQFSDELLEETINDYKKEFKVIPNQKFGHQYSFDVSIEMSVMINHYIKNGRKEILDLRKIRKSEDEGWLFMPLKSNKQIFSIDGISSIISRGFKKIGAPKGSGAHSIRRKYGKDAAKEIIERRTKHGMSLDQKDIIEELMDRLGWSTSSSMGCYTLGKRAIRQETIENRLRRQILELRGERARLMFENRRLRSVSSDCL